jgi:hypothetical protein
MPLRPRALSGLPHRGTHDLWGVTASLSLGVWVEDRVNFHRRCEDFRWTCKSPRCGHAQLPGDRSMIGRPRRASVGRFDVLISVEPPIEVQDEEICQLTSA